uniref:Uncharacterized protein n=1 Tax=Anguilla anguilla TaxID=7936 RepID=A0A0E9PCQ6_ANGAN
MQKIWGKWFRNAYHSHNFFTSLLLHRQAR